MNLLIQLKNIEYTVSGKTILEIPELSVYENEKIGIIGPNGAGKSTLLNLIAEKIQPTQGVIQTESTFNYYEQIKSSISELAEVDGELLSRFAVPKSAWTTLSGGQKTKYQLAQTLTNYPAGLLLDEPTTHLDSEGKKELIEELRYYYGTLLFVSHDRQFLNALADTIWEVDQGQVTVYKGNYEAYKLQKELKEEHQQRVFDEYQQEKNRLEDIVDEKKKQAQQVSQVSAKKKNKSIRPDRLAASKSKDTVQKNMHRQAKAAASRLEQLEEVSKPNQKHSIQFPKHLQAPIYNTYPLRVENLTVTYGEQTILNELSFQVPLGKKIAIKGKNGSGKSTLFQAVLDNQPGVVLSPNTKIVTYQQFDYQLKSDRSLLDFLLEDTDWSESTIRALLNNLGFAQENVRNPLHSLSGGEKTRVAIARLFTQPSNLLILDEPTNFIDLPTIIALQELLQKYQGSVLLTSHDQSFVKAVADDIWTLKNGKLKQ